MGLKYILTDDLVEVLTDILMALEMGDSIESTSVYHDELKGRLINYQWVDEEELDRRVKEELAERAK